MAHQQSLKLIHHLEELAANAWPAEVVQMVDGWRLRFNGGITRRANSVWPNGSDGDLSLAEKLALVEDFYVRRAISSRYQICPAAQPTDLDEILAGRGYIVDARTAIQTVSLETILTRARQPLSYPVTIAETFNESWFELFGYAEKVSAQAAEGRRNILRRIGPRTGFALLHDEAGQPVAIGLGVVERGWLGLYSLATHPQFRRRGAATSVIQTLARWGQAHGASQVYLQVMADNTPALALYARLGFETLYHYHYRELAR